MQRFGDDAANALAGIQGTVGVLKHHLESRAQGPQFSCRQGVQVVPAKPDAAAVGFVQSHDDACQRGFAAAGFAYQRQTLTVTETKTDPFEGVRVAWRRQQAAAQLTVMAVHVTHVEKAGRCGPGVDGWGTGVRGASREGIHDGCCGKKHRTQWGGPSAGTVRSGGSDSRQTSCACWQRSAKRQPCGRL